MLVVHSSTRSAPESAPESAAESAPESAPEPNPPWSEQPWESYNWGEQESPLEKRIKYYIIKKMKFNVNQQDLQQALNYCQGVIEKRSTLPILSNILLTANKIKVINK